MTIGRILLTLALAAGLTTRPAHASRVIHLDFSNFDLTTIFPTINGNTPPTQTDVDLIKETVIWEVVRNYAPFDVHVTDQPPVLGSSSLLRFVAGSGSVLGASGTNSGDCADCTGIGSADQYLTIAEVYLGNFAAQSQLSGTGATTARIARALAHAASHEIGHNLGLFHCNSADDFFSANVGTGDSTCFGLTADQNLTSHVMASGASTGLTNEQRATVDDFFSIHSSRRVLFDVLQPRGYWGRLRDIDNDDDYDLTYACPESYDVVRWKNRKSDGATMFLQETEFEDDAGEANDVFLHADVSGDGKADLVIGKVQSSGTIEWHVRTSTGTKFGPSSVWIADAGEVGDTFRLGDVNGDGRKDLIAGRPADPAGVLGWIWDVYASTGTSFAPATGAVNTVCTGLNLDFLVADATGDGRDDLISVERTDPETTVKVFESQGTYFDHLEGTNFHPTFQHIDYVHAGDVNGDGLADMIFGHVVDDTTVDWYVGVRLPVCIPGTGVPCFNSLTAWRTDGSSAGDQTHIGDPDGDGRIDLLYGRAEGQDSLTAAPDLDPLVWRARLSTGTAFGSTSKWADDAGSEGWIVP